jgi:hypothetical protein
MMRHLDRSVGYGEERWVDVENSTLSSPSTTATEKPKRRLLAESAQAVNSTAPTTTPKEQALKGAVIVTSCGLMLALLVWLVRLAL